MQIFILVIFLLLSIFYFFKISRKFDFFTMFFLASILFYIFYPLLDLVNDAYQVEDNNFVIIYLYIFSTTLLISLFFNIFFPKNKRKMISISQMNIMAAQTTRKQFLSLVALVFGLILYFFIKDGFIFRIVTINYNSDINKYNIFLGAIIIPFLYAVQIIAYNKYIIERKKSYLFFVIVSLIYFLFFGRRELILSVIFLFYVFSSYHSFKLLKIKNIFSLLLIFIFIIVGINFYQNIRETIFMYSITKKIEINKPIIDLFFDFNASEKNISDRNSLLKMFNDVVININKSNVSNGRVLIENIKTSIPSIIYPDKISINEDAIIAETLNLKPTDFSASNATLFLMDFSYISIILYPIFIVFSWKFLATIVSFTRKNNNFLALISLVSIFYLIFNIEGSFSDVLTRIQICIAIYFVSWLWIIVNNKINKVL